MLTTRIGEFEFKDGYPVGDKLNLIGGPVVRFSIPLEETEYGDPR